MQSVQMFWDVIPTYCIREEKILEDEPGITQISKESI